MAAFGALLALFLLIGLIVAYPLIALAVALLALVTWPAHLGRRVVLPEAVRRPQTPPWRIQASHVPESWGEPNGRWIVVPDQGPPDPEPLFLAENLPGSDDPVSVYIENVKRAHRIGGRKPKPTKPKPLIWDPARVKTEAVASRPVRPEDVPATHPMRRRFEDAGLPWPPA
jgi:hypothetical protein